jgi:hypothetical protein
MELFMKIKGSDMPPESSSFSSGTAPPEVPQEYTDID